MNKKEIAEIKKQFTPDRCAITRICGCYVDSEKNKKTELKEAFLSLSEEEMFKYFEIFKKTLSGTIGKNLINMDFPLEQEKEGVNFRIMLYLRNFMIRSSKIMIMVRITISFSFMPFTIFPESLPMVRRCSMHPMKSMTISSAASVRSIFPKPACATTQKPTTSKTVSVTGS